MTNRSGTRGRRSADGAVWQPGGGTFRLADFLPWAALVGQGIVLNKDGSFQRTARFRGPDLDSAVPAELVAVAGRLNNAFRRLGSEIGRAHV